MKCLAIAIFALVSSAAMAGGILNVLLGGYIPILGSSASPSSISYSYPSATLTSGSTTCAGSGGVPPYTYAWSWASGGASITINSASSATTSFGVSGAALNTTYTGTARCLVTDRRPLSAPYANVSVSLSRIPLLPPSVGTATLVAGTSGAFVGYDSGGEGSLSPSTDYNGHAVVGLSCNTIEGTLVLSVHQPSANVNYITTLRINSTNYAESSSSYNYINGTTGTWAWTVTCPFSSGSSYNVLYY